MVDIRIHIREESIFVRRRPVPRRGRLLVGEADLDQALATLEAVFPWHHQPDRRATLVGQYFAVDAKGQQCQRVHRLVHAQSFHIRPVEHTRSDKRHGLGICQRHELDVLCCAKRLDLPDQLGQGVTDPRYHHRPTLHTTQTVDALLLCTEFEQVLQRILCRLLDQAFNFHRPWRSFEAVRVLRRIGLVGAELVEVVVGRGVFIVGHFFHRHRAGHRRLPARQRRQLARTRLLCLRMAHSPRGQRHASEATRHLLDQFAAAAVNLRRSDFTGDWMDKSVGGGLDDHGTVLESAMVVVRATGFLQSSCARPGRSHRTDAGRVGIQPRLQSKRAGIPR